MRLSASTVSKLYGKMRVEGFKNDAGEVFISQVFKVGSTVNLLEFERGDRNLPAGFSRADVAKMTALLANHGVEIEDKQSNLWERAAAERPRRGTVEVHDAVEDVSVVVVDGMEDANIFQEFRLLNQGEGIGESAIQILEAKNMPYEKRLDFAKKFVRSLIGDPVQCEFLDPKSYWGQIMPWAATALCSDNAEWTAKKARWMCFNRSLSIKPVKWLKHADRARVFPTMPQPQTWKDGQSGHVPNDGKR